MKSCDFLICIFIIFVGLCIYYICKQLICHRTYKNLKKDNIAQSSIENTRAIIQNGGGFIIDRFQPFYNIINFGEYAWTQEEICNNFGSVCITVNDTLNFLNRNLGQYASNILYNTFENIYEEEARDQYLFSVESFTQAENKRISNITAQTSRYINQNQFDFMFQFMYPVDSNEINIYLWEFQMYIYLDMLDFLNMISQSGGQFMVNRINFAFREYHDFSPSFRITNIEKYGYTIMPYTFTIDNFTLSRLLWYTPTGTWTYEFMLLLSLYNLVTTEPWLEPNMNIVHPQAINQSFFTYDLQINLTKGIFMPIVSPGSWIDFIFGAVKGGNTESKFKLEWNSSFTNTYSANKKITNAYGQIVDAPDYSFNGNENPATKNSYKDYLFNSLVYNILEYENPIVLPYSNDNIMNNVIKFVDQNLALRKQDFNRRINLSRTEYFTLQGCNNAILSYANFNGSVNGYTGYLTYMRENILDTINDFPTFKLSGWFFNIIKPLINNLLPRFPRLVINGSISTNNLIEIKRLEGSYKPVSQPTTLPAFGACRPATSSCKTCRSAGGCTAANCNKLRSHAANDYYGNIGVDVLSTYYGTVIGIQDEFFTDQCKLGSRNVDDMCAQNYTCRGGFCLRCAPNSNCLRTTGQKYVLPAISIKHIDGTIGRYGEFPSVVITGQEVKAGQKIGTIVSQTLQCHFEFYAGTVNMIPWVEGGFGRNSANALGIMNTWISRLTVDIDPPARSAFPTLFNYQYVENDPRCIPGCNFPCKYKRRRDLVNTDNARNWA